jgi:hypothetical protein
MSTKYFYTRLVYGKAVKRPMSQPWSQLKKTIKIFKSFISENNNIVEEKFSFSSSFPRENIIYLKKNVTALSSEIISYCTFRL